MTSQLTRLACPFPPQYVKKPAQGKYGSYVPHDVVTQALLAIVGPYDLHVGDVFYGKDGAVEGCLVTLAVTIDGQGVCVTEVGDCEQPTNWKTQGARMKDAISDGVKRCAMRLGLGLHLWAQEDYFLYDQLKGSEGSAGVGEVSRRPSGESSEGRQPPVNADAEEGARRSRPATPSGNNAEGPAASAPAEVESSTTPSAGQSPRPKATIQKLRSRASALVADHVPVADARIAVGLPPIEKSSAEELERWDGLLSDLERDLEKPFTETNA